VFYGHSHRHSFDQNRRNSSHQPASHGLQFWRPQPVGWMDAKISREGIDLTLHAYAGYTGTTVRVRRCAGARSVLGIVTQYPDSVADNRRMHEPQPPAHPGRSESQEPESGATGGGRTYNRWVARRSDQTSSITPRHIREGSLCRLPAVGNSFSGAPPSEHTDKAVRTNASTLPLSAFTAAGGRTMQSSSDAERQCSALCDVDERLFPDAVATVERAAGRRPEDLRRHPEASGGQRDRCGLDRDARSLAPR